MPLRRRPVKRITNTRHLIRQFKVSILITRQVIRLVDAHPAPVLAGVPVVVIDVSRVPVRRARRPRVFVFVGAAARRFRWFFVFVWVRPMVFVAVAVAAPELRVAAVGSRGEVGVGVGVFWVRVS